MSWQNQMNQQAQFEVNNGMGRQSTHNMNWQQAQAYNGARTMAEQQQYNTWNNQQNNRW